MSGIYQVYTIIINFLGFPDGSLMKMLRRVENEKFTFKIDTEIALVDRTIGTLVPTVELAS